MVTPSHPPDPSRRRTSEEPSSMATSSVKKRIERIVKEAGRPREDPPREAEPMLWSCDGERPQHEPALGEKGIGLGGLVPTKIFATGHSQSALRLTTYVNAVHPLEKVIDGFVPRADLLMPAQHAMLYRRGSGRLRSALDLPAVDPG